MLGDKRRLANLRRAERTGHFQEQLGGNREMQWALRQQKVFGVQISVAEVLVRSSEVTPGGRAGEGAGWMDLLGIAQLLEEYSHLQLLNHWNPAVAGEWATWADPF